MPRAATLAAILLAVCPFSATADGPYIEDVFERTAGLSGETYAISRDLLARQGKGLLPFARKRAQCPRARPLGPLRSSAGPLRRSGQRARSALLLRGARAPQGGARRDRS